ncbi:MAG: HD domain-containing protein [Elusimicrobiaceae bacterium]|nr:HD domain-containing protein [Elusimicrobiaceae bacterium]
MPTKFSAGKKLQLLIRFGGEIAREPRLDRLTRLIGEQVREILNADRCTVFLVDAATGNLWSILAQGLDQQEIMMPRGKGIAGLVSESGRPINIDDAYSDPRFTVDIDRVTGYKTRNILAVPLRDNRGGIIGVFQVLNKLDGTSFTQEDEGILHLLGTVAANTVETARLYEKLRKAQLETIYRLAVTAEYRDQQDTARHLKNISVLSYLLSRALGLSAEESEIIKLASPLHDIGKVALPDAILLKPGKLTEPEYEEMKRHAVYGSRILANAESDLLQAAYRVAAQHHEKYDGTGYPSGLKGGDISREARIVAVADVFDALCMPRVYKAAWKTEVAGQYISGQAGKAFDPEVTAAFERIFPFVRRLYDENTDAEEVVRAAEFKLLSAPNPDAQAAGNRSIHGE